MFIHHSGDFFFSDDDFYPITMTTSTRHHVLTKEFDLRPTTCRMITPPIPTHPRQMSSVCDAVVHTLFGRPGMYDLAAGRWTHV